MNDKKRVEILEKFHSVSKEFSREIPIDEIIQIVITYGLVSALSVNTEPAAMEVIRDCLADAVSIRRQAERNKTF